jgi:copper transport protein
MYRPSRWLARAAVVAGLSSGLIIGSAAAAQAHAVLEQTSPAEGSIVATAPRQVTLTFGENVDLSSDDVQVYNDQLHRVDTGHAGHITGHDDTVGVALHPSLPHGTYTVTWRVISADSHPVSGGYTFSIGAPSHVAGTVAGLGGGSRTVGVLLGTMRLLGYLGLIAGAGGLAFLLLWPAGPRDLPTRRIITTGLLLSVVAAAGGFVLEAPYGQGQPLSTAFHWAGLSDVANSRYGHALLIRLGLFLVLLAIPRKLWGQRNAAGSLPLVLCAAAIVTWAVAGHGGVGNDVPLSILSQSIHVAAMTVWLGGLLLLATRLLSREHRGDAMTIVPRFSAVALICVATIVVTGSYQAYREIGISWTALATTTYGKLVLAKVVGIAALIALGSLARRTLRGLRRQTAQTTPQGLDRLRAGVAFEVQIGIAVLVLTSILVNTVPAKQSESAVAHQTLTAPGLRLDVTVNPTRTGPATISLTASTSTGAPQPITTVTGSLSLASRGIASLPVTFTVRRGSDIATAQTSFAASGTWRLSLDLQTSPIDATSLATNFDVK